MTVIPVPRRNVRPTAIVIGVARPVTGVMTAGVNQPAVVARAGTGPVRPRFGGQPPRRHPRQS